MEKTIKASFKDEDRALAQEIGQRSEGTTLNEKIEELFYELPDPLLSAVDVKDLLGTEDKLAEYKSALGELTGNGVLEVSTSTQRPFDEEDVELYRHKDTHVERLRLIAQEEELDEGHRRIQFTCDGRLIRSLARVDRLDVYAADETGPQRNEFKRHIEDIAESVSDGTHIPSPILLAIDEQNVETLEDGGDEADIPTSRVIIRPLTDYEVVENPIEPTGSPAQKVRTIEIDFPFRRATFDGEKAASVVDGQQRTAALALVPVDVRPTCGVSIEAVVADHDEAMRVFQVANNTKKISTDHSKALSAELEEAPGYLVQEKKIAQAVKQLALTDDDSPFFGIVKYPNVKAKRRVIAFNSLFQVCEDFDDSVMGQESSEELANLVARAFSIVKGVWPEAWGEPSKTSRLMHGAGLRATAFLLVHKLDVGKEAGHTDEEIWADLEESVKRLQPVVKWTEDSAMEATAEAKEVWLTEIGNRQNTAQDIEALKKFLKKTSFELDQQARNE